VPGLDKESADPESIETPAIALFEANSPAALTVFGERLTEN